MAVFPVVMEPAPPDPNAEPDPDAEPPMILMMGSNATPADKPSDR